MVKGARAVRCKAWLGVLCAVLCALSTMIFPMATHAHAQDSPLEIIVNPIDPISIGDSGDLKITGTITNHSDHVLSDITVCLWRDATPLDSVKLFKDAIHNDPLGGAVMYSDSASEYVDTDLAPGQSHPFSVSASLSGLKDELLYLSIPNAVYQVGVNVHAYSDQGDDIVARARSFVTYASDQSLPWTSVLLLTHRPTRIMLDTGEDAVFTDDSLAADLQTSLRSLLDYALSSQVSVVIDPMLFDDVTALANGDYLVSDGSSTSPGRYRIRAAAQRWLGDVQQLIDQKRVSRTLYGALDIAHLDGNDRDRMVRAAAHLSPAHPLSSLPFAIVNDRAPLDASMGALLDSLSPAWVATVGIDHAATDRSTRYLPVSDLLEKSKQFSDNDRRITSTITAEQFIYLHDHQPRITVIDSVHDLDLLPSVQSWQHPSTVEKMLEDFTADAPMAFGDLEQVSMRAHSDEAIDLAHRWQAILDKPHEVDEELYRSIAAGWNVAFTSDDQAVAWLDSALAAARKTFTGDVTVRVSNWVTTSAQDNLLPVTVVNNSDRALRLKVHFHSDNDLRITVADSDLLTIAPHESSTVRVRPTTRGNGKVGIEAFVVSVEGDVISAPAAFTITATDVGKVAWIIIVASSVVLVVASALRIRRVRLDRQRASAAAAKEAATTPHLHQESE